MHLVSYDTMFKDEKQTNEAYAVAWAMMFYLAEHQPREPRPLSNAKTERQPSETCRCGIRGTFFQGIVGSHLTSAKK